MPTPDRLVPRKRDMPDWQTFLRIVNGLGAPRGRGQGDGSMPANVEPPRDPRPLAGGAGAPLEFDD
jgi:hypothetical protein